MVLSTGGQASGAYAPSPLARIAMLPLPRPRLFGPRHSVSVPLERRLPRNLGTFLTLAFFAAVGVAGVVVGGHMAEFRAQYGEPQHALGRALGFGLDRITIKGIDELRAAEILEAVGITPKVSLAFLDAAETRTRLEAMPLVRQASVRKLYPNALALTITEREPYAIWQRNGELFLVAQDGTVIDLMRDARFARLPLVVGDEANARAKEYAALLDEAGALKNRIRAGTLIAGRRWNLKLDNGIDIRLPEHGAAEALARFVALERDNRITDKDILAVDLRMADRVMVRLTEEAAAARAETQKKKPKGKGAEI
jgi:cell division protein FtsQ